MTAAIQLLNYAATHPEAKIRLHANDIILHIHSDASYLSTTESRSQYAGYLFLSDNIGNTAPLPDAPALPLNAPVQVNSGIIKAILSSAAEVELGTLF